MIEPQSAQDGESALTLNATLVPPPRSIGLIGNLLTVCPLPFPFVCPFASTPSPASAVATAVALGGSASPASPFSETPAEGPAEAPPRGEEPRSGARGASVPE